MKNNKIKGVGDYRIQYIPVTCTECNVNTEERYTFKGRCADCRANEYGVMPHQAMEYEFKNGMREEAELEASTIETAETTNAKGETAMAVATTPVTDTSITDVTAKGIDTNIIVERDERHFCTCATCKQTTVIDFRVVVWEFAFLTSNGDVAWEPRTTTFRDGKEVSSTYIAVCPRCNAARPQNKTLKAKVCKKHVCGNECRSATGDSCVCSCGGENHGVNHRLSIYIPA